MQAQCLGCGFFRLGWAVQGGVDGFKLDDRQEMFVVARLNAKFFGRLSCFGRVSYCICVCSDAWLERDAHGGRSPVREVS